MSFKPTYKMGSWGSSQETATAAELRALRLEWQDGYHPLALLSGERGTAFQALFVQSQLLVYNSHFRDHRDSPANTDYVLGVLSDWASLLMVTTLIRRGSWESTFLGDLASFCCAGKLDKWVLPSPFDPQFTTRTSIARVTPHHGRYVHFGSFWAFFQAFTLVSAPSFLKQAHQSTSLFFNRPSAQSQRLSQKI